MTTSTNSNRRSPIETKPTQGKAVSDTGLELVQDILLLVDRYVSAERGRVVREGMVKRRARLQAEAADQNHGAAPVPEPNRADADSRHEGL